MQHWRAAFLGRRRLPRALSAFELEAFFTFTGAERRAIEQRRTPALRLGLALQLGFLRLCGQPLAAVGAVPPALIGRIAPTRTEGINLRGVFRFPVEAYAEKLLLSTPRRAAAGAG